MKLVGGPSAVGHELIDLAPDVCLAILTTLAGGWHYAKVHADVNIGAGEVTITERLRDGMRQVLGTGGFPWAKSLWVLPGSESRSREALVPDGRTDIPLGVVEIFLQRGEHDPHAIVECKRVAGSDADLCRQYVLEGIDRFRSGKYAFKHSAGFMVGYLLSGTDAEAVGRINAHVVRQGWIDEELEKPGATLSTWVSRHDRVSLSTPITLHHAFFELAGRPSRTEPEGGGRI